MTSRVGCRDALFVLVLMIRFLISGDLFETGR